MSNQENESNKEFDQQKDEQESEYIEKLPEELKNLNLPPEIKKEIRTFLSMGRFSGSSISPIIDKINQQHITKILESVEKDSERAFVDAQEARKYNLVAICIFVAVFVFLTVFLVNKDVAVYQDILKILIIFGGGFGSGLGFKIYLDRKNK
ncbi:MAG: hypothetical protein HWQ41_23290 [Nostoc sp. NOS(2021)]|uniref:hypothetical protein n=1 Tax=Nostoc sp. NOS(2021) TaxID=2815407 RepID=UPI0025F1FD18|nr:hypothetical protein [Nostoc sp. NOS(2021)]MBN3898086.1 hypothetical protein [Nostoc sp. NOS(2021)]